VNNSKEILDFISTYEDGEVEVSEGVSYSMREVNNRSYRLYNGLLANKAVEPSGFKNIFARKMWVVYRSLVQGSDLDLKNLNTRSLNGVKVRLTSLLRMAYISHLDRNFFGEFVDKIMAEMCWFGSSIVKRFDGTVDTVDLRNYITEPNIQDPQERRHAELCYYSYDEMLANKEEWKDAWESVENNWECMQKAGESQFKVIEFWTWGKLKEDTIHKICVKFLDNTITEKEDFHTKDDWAPYVELERFKTPYKKRRISKKMRDKLGEYEEIFPYEQFDLFKVFGRQQAFGCGELLSDAQMMYNTLFNSQLKNTLKAQMGLHVHNAVQGLNGLTELLQENISNLISGGVVTLSPGESISNFPIETRAQDFDLMEQKIFELMKQIIGITAGGTGEEMPASTSATQIQDNRITANTVFDFVRERMHHGFKRLFNNGYKDDILEEIDENEMTAIMGDPAQMEELDKMLVDNAVAKWAQEMKNEMGMYPSEAEMLAVREAIEMDLAAQGDMRYPEIKKALLKDMNWMLVFEFTQEAFDTQGRYNALLAIKNDPQSTKSKAKIEDEILNLQGLNPRQYDLSAEEIAAREQEQMAAQMEEQQTQQAQLPPQPVM
jgi:hypothetical protein